MPLSTGAVVQDKSNTVNGQIIVSAAESLWREDQACFRKSIAATISQDERDQVMCLMCKFAYWQGERLKTKSVLLGVLRDFGFGAESIRNGLERALRTFCTMRRGKRSANASRDTGAADSLDEALFRHAQKIIWKASRDDAGDEVNSFRIAAHDGLLPNLQTASWDGSHCVRAQSRNVTAAEPLLAETLPMLRAFFNHVRSSARYQQLFRAAQQEHLDAAADADDFILFDRVLQSLAYAEQRLDSQSTPFLRFFMLLPCALRALEMEANSEKKGPSCPCTGAVATSVGCGRLRTSPDSGIAYGLDGGSASFRAPGRG